jgi:hypothetical protein
MLESLTRLLARVKALETCIFLHMEDKVSEQYAATIKGPSRENFILLVPFHEDLQQSGVFVRAQSASNSNASVNSKSYAKMF